MRSLSAGRARSRDGAASGRCAGAAALLLAACGGHQSGERPPPTVGVVTIEPQPVTLTTELPGRTSPFEVADVRPQVGGIIQARLFTEGSIVKAGQVLYQIEPAPYQAAYDQAKAQLANAEANLADAQAEGRSPRRPREAQLGRQAGRRRRRGRVQAGRRPPCSRTRPPLEAARINLAYTQVTAPITGRIGISTVTKGALVTADPDHGARHHPAARSDLCRHHPVGVEVLALRAADARRAGCGPTPAPPRRI